MAGSPDIMSAIMKPPPSVRRGGRCLPATEMEVAEEAAAILKGKTGGGDYSIKLAKSNSKNSTPALCGLVLLGCW